MLTSAPNRTLFVLICAGVLWLVLGSALRAQAPADLAEYDEVLKQAVEAHHEQRWQEAHALFERAHALYPNARTLRGMGISAFEAGQHAIALRDLEASLEHPERPLPPDLRPSVEALVAHLRGLIGVYLFRLEPEGAQLRIDDAEPIVSPHGEVLLDPGSHLAVVSLEGHVTQTLELDAHGGDRSELRVQLLATPALPPPISAAPPRDPVIAVKPLAPHIDEGWSWQRRSALITGGLGVLSFATAGALYGVARGRIRDIAKACDPGCTLAMANEMKRKRDVPRLEHGMTATLVVGSTLVVASAVLLVLDYRARKKGSTQTALLPLGVRF